MFKFKQFAIHQDHAAMKVGTDSDLLGVLSEGGSHVLDIGTGTGVLALMLAQRCPEAKVEAVEIDDDAVKDASLNFAESPFADRISLHHCSFQDFLTQQSSLQQSLSQGAATESLEQSADSLEQSADSLAQSAAKFDAIVCNPPYFHQSLECGDNLGRTRARHSSSLPFDVLVGGAYALLRQEGVFSVCIPPEVLPNFTYESTQAGFRLYKMYKIKSLPHKPVKRYVLVYKKGKVEATQEFECCMRNADHTRSEWYRQLLKDFLLDT